MADPQGPRTGAEDRGPEPGSPRAAASATNDTEVLKVGAPPAADDRPAPATPATPEIAVTPPSPEAAVSPQSPDAAAGPDSRRGPGAAEAGGRAREAGKAGRTRRRRVWAMALVVVLLVLAALGGGAVWAESYARSRLTDAVNHALPGLSDDAVVTAEGVLLPQVLSGKLDSLTVDADSLVLESSAAPVVASSIRLASLELTDVKIALAGLDLDKPHTTDSVEVVASVGFEELTSLVAVLEPDLPDMTVSAQTFGSSSEPGSMSAETSFLGLDAEITMVPSVTQDGGLVLDMTTVSIQGAEVDLDAEIAGKTWLSYLGVDSSQIRIGPEILPEGLTLSNVYVARDGLRLTLTGSGVDLDSV